MIQGHAGESEGDSRIKLASPSHCKLIRSKPVALCTFPSKRSRSWKNTSNIEDCKQKLASVTAPVHIDRFVHAATLVAEGLGG
jgi:hypothetical protein